MPTEAPPPLRQADIAGVELLHRGKVRDIFAVDDDTLLLVASDRISAFDVVLPDLLPRKGEILNRISEFWFRRLNPRHHLKTIDLAEMPAPLPEHPELKGRAMLVKRVTPLQAEFVVRGYLAGSAWKEYQKLGSVCGIALPSGMKESEKFPEPLFTPSTKAPQGEHDENISFDRLTDIIGTEHATQARDLVMDLYQQAHSHAADRGILLADTKIEVGEDEQGLVVIDELFTPDSSRFWPADRYETGRGQPSYDKQIVRDALLKTDWNREPPGPRLPAEILEQAASAYVEIYEKLTDSPLDG